MNGQLTIGAFAKRCGISPSALRFYDECALLRPAAVDELTGYRYYAPAQLETARLIRRLRDVELPVEQVRTFLVAEPSERAALLDAHLEAVEAHLSTVRAAASALRAQIGQRAYRGERGCCIVSAPQLADALEQVGFAALRSGERAELDAVLVEVKEGSLRLVATDTHRLAVRDLLPDELTGEGSGRRLVSSGDLAGLTGRLRGARRCTLVAIDGGRLALELDGVSIALEDVPDRFPDYEQVLANLERGPRCVVGRHELQRAIASFDAETASLTFYCSHLELEAGDRRERVGCDYDGEALTVVLRVAYVADALRAQVGPDVAIEVTEKLAPVTFRSADHGSFAMLVMPIRTA